MLSVHMAACRQSKIKPSEFKLLQKETSIAKNKGRLQLIHANSPTAITPAKSKQEGKMNPKPQRQCTFDRSSFEVS